jgi:hypothetical protein
MMAWRYTKWQVRVMDDGGYKGGTATGGIVGSIAAAVTLILTLPIVGLVAFVTGGCEGAPRPCRSNDWLFLSAGVLALGVALIVFFAVRHWIDRKRAVRSE